MHPFLEDAKNLFLDTIFPVYCLGCGAEGLFLCAGCQNNLKRVAHQECIVCRKPSLGGQTHRQCQTAETPDYLISALDYKDPLVAEAIISGKYKFLPDVFCTLGSALADYISANGLLVIPGNGKFCPLPLAMQRLRWRGFNQAELIISSLKQAFPFGTTALLRRIKNTRTQKDLNRGQRLSNMAGGFGLKPNNFETGPIILVDDVVTTGATLLEAAKILKTAGIKSVWCLTLARD